MVLVCADVNDWWCAGVGVVGRRVVDKPRAASQVKWCSLVRIAVVIKVRGVQRNGPIATGIDAGGVSSQAKIPVVIAHAVPVAVWAGIGGPYELRIGVDVAGVPDQRTPPGYEPSNGESR
jgi:hypothetical protein